MDHNHAPYTPRPICIITSLTKQTQPVFLLFIRSVVFCTIIYDALRSLHHKGRHGCELCEVKPGNVIIPEPQNTRCVLPCKESFFILSVCFDSSS